MFAEANLAFIDALLQLVAVWKEAYSEDGTYIFPQAFAEVL
jgi:hypothetical protein